MLRAFETKLRDSESFKDVKSCLLDGTDGWTVQIGYVGESLRTFLKYLYVV